MGTTYYTDYLIKGLLQHNYSLVKTTNYIEGEPRETITLHYRGSMCQTAHYVTLPFLYPLVAPSDVRKQVMSYSNDVTRPRHPVDTLRVDVVPPTPRPRVCDVITVLP